MGLGAIDTDRQHAEGKQTPSLSSCMGLRVLVLATRKQGVGSPQVAVTKHDEHLQRVRLAGVG